MDFNHKKYTLNIISELVSLYNSDTKLHKYEVFSSLMTKLLDFKYNMFNYIEINKITNEMYRLSISDINGNWISLNTDGIKDKLYVSKNQIKRIIIFIETILHKWYCFNKKDLYLL